MVKNQRVNAMSCYSMDLPDDHIWYCFIYDDVREGICFQVDPHGGFSVKERANIIILLEKIHSLLS